MKTGLSHACRRGVIAALLSLVFTIPAGADATKKYYVNVHDPVSATGGIFIAQGDVNEGVLLHEVTLARFECAELAQGRDGSLNWYARAASADGGTKWYLKIVDIQEGVGSAMGGIARSGGSPDLCGAAAIAPRVLYNTLFRELPSGSW